MRAHVCIDMRVGVDLCVGTRLHKCVDTGVDMRVATCANMCADKCVKTGRVVALALAREYARCAPISWGPHDDGRGGH